MAEQMFCEAMTSSLQANKEFKNTEDGIGIDARLEKIFYKENLIWQRVTKVHRIQTNKIDGHSHFYGECNCGKNHKFMDWDDPTKVKHFTDIATGSIIIEKIYD